MWRPSFYSLLFSSLFCIFLWDILHDTNTLPLSLRTPNIRLVILTIALFGFVTTLYFSFRSFFRFNRFRILNLVFIVVSLIPFCAGAYLANSTIATGLTFIYKPYFVTVPYLQVLSANALEDHSEEVRYCSAKAAYTVYNMRLAYVTGAGDLAAFVPTADDILVRKGLSESEERAKEPREQLINLFQKTPENVLIVTISTSCYFLALLIGDLLYSSFNIEHIVSNKVIRVFLILTCLVAVLIIGSHWFHPLVLPVFPLVFPMFFFWDTEWESVLGVSGTMVVVWIISVPGTYILAWLCSRYILIRRQCDRAPNMKE